MINGNIHTSTRVEAEELACDQLMQVSEIIAQAISVLADVVEETYVYTTYGNHGRAVPNKKESVHRDNYERLIPWWLKWRLVDRDDVHVMQDDGTEFVYLDVCGYGVCCCHGDLDKFSTSPRTLSTLFRRKHSPAEVDYIILGDRHHREELEEFGISAMLTGSLCGTDSYANERRLYSTPEQLLLIFNEEVGVDATYHIKCK